MSEKMRSESNCRADGNMQRNGYNYSGKGGASYVGRTLYFRETGFRRDIFFRAVRLGAHFARTGIFPAENRGKKNSVDRLAEIFFELKEKGANNINLVTPDHFIPQIMEAIDIAKKGWL